MIEKLKGDTTSIEWVLAVARAKGMRAAVWNPQRGCSRAGAGCDHCWAAKIAHMRALQKNPKVKAKYGGLTRKVGERIEFNGVVRTVPEDLGLPGRTKAPTVYFMGSETDLFHPNADWKFTEIYFRLAAMSPHHLFLVLTKRPDIMRAFIEAGGLDYSGQNIWLGTSVWDQPSANKYIPDLLAVPAHKKFVSYEPAREAVDFRHWIDPPWHLSEWKIDWLIAGCLSKPNQPIPEGVPDLLHDQCKQHGRAFFYKQDVIDGKLVHLPNLNGQPCIEVPI